MNSKKQRNILFPLTIFLFFGIFCSARAADPELIVTWRADNFYPSSYTGKAMPSFGTKIYLALEAIRDGKLLDLSSTPIEWRKNGDLIKRGSGQNEAVVSFSETDATGFVSVSATFEDKTIQKSISIPVTDPKLVLEIPFYKNIVPKNTDISILAMPYFFNTTSFNDFSFSWQVGALKKGTGTNNKITINTGNPSVAIDKTVLISGYIQNKHSLMEIVKTQKKIIIGD